MKREISHLAVMRNRVAVRGGVGEMRVVDLLQMIALGEISCDEDDGSKQEPSKQDESDHDKLHHSITSD